MSWVIVGLGNPGEEYQRTRHNTGRLALEYFAKMHDLADWKEDKKTKATIARGTIGKALTVLVLPDTFMNKSGSAVSKYIKNPKAAEHMAVIYDDLDLPLGVMKISFDRGSGGHKGVESVMRAVKTKKFARVRIGVSPPASSGAPKKPSGEKAVLDFILRPFPPHEMEILKRVFKKAGQALETLATRGVVAAMNEFN